MSEVQMFGWIPDEIMVAIFELITSPKDLKSLCLANKRCNLIGRGLLWRKPNLRLKQFTIEEFKWISKMPIQVLDISNLVVYQEGVGVRWSRSHICGSKDLDAPSAIDLFKVINEMDHK